MDNLRLWTKLLDSVKSKISPANFRTFFAVTKIQSISDGQITISTPSAFVKENLKQKHLDLIEKELEAISGKKLKVDFVVKEFDVPKQDAEDFFQPVQTHTSTLNSKYSLENFVVGPTNNVAFAGAQAVAQNPGSVYNPLFLYGGTGVGKTHLMIGTGNAILKTKPHASVIYCSSEKFMNDYVSAIQNHNMADLRRKYRSADVLLIDDVNRKSVV